MRLNTQKKEKKKTFLFIYIRGRRPLIRSSTTDGPSPGDKVLKTLRIDLFMNGFNDEARKNVLVFIACIAVFGVGATSPSNVGDDGGVIVLAVRKCC